MIETLYGKIRGIDCHDATLTVEYGTSEWRSQYTFPINVPGMTVIGPLQVGDDVVLIFDGDERVEIRRRW